MSRDPRSLPAWCRAWRWVDRFCQSGVDGLLELVGLQRKSGQPEPERAYPRTRVNLRPEPLDLPDDELTQIFDGVDAEYARYQHDYRASLNYLNGLVYEHARRLGHRPTEVADAFGGYKCACSLTSWSHDSRYGPRGGCPVGYPSARRAIKRHHDFGHRNNLRLDQGRKLCLAFGCDYEDDDCSPKCGMGPCKHFPTAT